MSAEPRIIINDSGNPEIIPGEIRVVVQQGAALQQVPGPEMLVFTDRGPSGPPGAGDFVHVQSTPATEWIVNHNKGLQPLVAVKTSGGVEIEAQVVHTSNNQLRLYFNAPFTGLARCI